jgi:hypothetical protein
MNNNQLQQGNFLLYSLNDEQISIQVYFKDENSVHSILEYTAQDGKNYNTRFYK